ncbi:S8 family serine peptidase [Spirillospora sp. NPDC048823]|uniref:S8 family serine peptidase n=1 Tax=unclassified Spirillospora TaxID=2642701 RepID=UPI0037114A63
MTPRSRSRALLGILLAAGALTATPAPAQADPPPPPTGGLPSGKAWKVTLLTGDVVQVRTVEGKPPMVSVTPAPGREKRSFRKEIRPDGHVVVTPLDIAPLAGRVIDRELFDVTALISQGYDDARSKDLPLIVQRDKGVHAMSALGGALDKTRDLPSIDAVAVRQSKDDARTLGDALAGMRGPSAKATGGIRRIWLDGRVKANFAPTAPTARRFDRNLRQVGAPKAWRAGYTGKGAEVAVLDTGVDAGHPDLKGRIAATKNFSESPGTADRLGHGTHVAATIAGTGAASGGERKGMAPDADLLIGKVLDDRGYGTDSGVIAGMQWAAPRADVVNMSLGGFPTDGTDPLSVALDNLTAEHGTLFVVAAGNDGAIQSVGAPGTAKAALTVGAVDAHDALAEFSSRGPVGHTAKPEIVAPGVEIVAARAEGTALGTPIGANYTKMSGTSMAAPHVAGAAALLAAKHPRWKPARLKAALVGTGDPATGGDAYERGAGRLDAGDAARAPVLTAQSIVDLGTSQYPDHGALSTELGWTSNASRPVHMRLSVEVVDRQGRTAHGAASVPARVEIPAGATASAELEIDASKLAGRPGLYTAVVTAKGAGATLETPVTFYVEPPTHTLTVKATPLPGTDAADLYAYATVTHLTDIVELSTIVEVLDGTTEIRVPEGRYAVLGSVQHGGTGGNDWRYALAGTPEVLVDHDMTVTLDGAKARPATVSVEGTRTKALSNYAAVVRSTRQGIWTMLVTSGDAETSPMMLQPMDAPETGGFRAYTAHRLSGPEGFYDVLRPLGGGIPADPSHVITTAAQARMARVHQRFAAFGGNESELISDKRYGLTPEGLLLFDGLASDTPAGTTRTDHVSTGGGVRWLAWGSPQGIPDGWVDQSTFLELRPGRRVEHTWGRQPLRPGPYSATGVSPSICTPAPTTRTRGNLHVQLVDLQTRPDGFDCGVNGIKGKLTLFAGDEKLGEKEGPAGDFLIPSGRREYRLTYRNDASAILPVSTRTSTSWTFRSPAPRGNESVRVPLLTVDYDLGLDLRNQPTGKPAVLTVARVAGTGGAKVTGLRFWTSLDDGKTWQAAAVKPLGEGRFSAPLPPAAGGRSVSVRVTAADAGGSGIDQQIIRAYRIR